MRALEIPASLAITFVDALSYPCVENSLSAALRSASRLRGSKSNIVFNVVFSFLRHLPIRSILLYTFLPNRSMAKKQGTLGKHFCGVLNWQAMQSGTHSAILLRKIACWWTAPNPPEQLNTGAGCAFLRNALSRAVGPQSCTGRWRCQGSR